MTPAEVITAAFTRNLGVEHIKTTDIAISKFRYVDTYISGYSAGTYYDDFVKPVIAYGVAVDIFERLAATISDKGVVRLIGDGAVIYDRDGLAKTKKEFAEVRDNLIELMTANAPNEVTVINKGIVKGIYTTTQATNTNRL